MNSTITIEYFGHSCFRVTCAEYSVILDPYHDDSVPGLKLPEHLTANKVLISHGHEDHNAAENIDVVHTSARDPFLISAITVPHDNCGGQKRGMVRMHILEAEGMKVVHFGDLGRMLNTDEMQRLHHADCIMIPCGGFFTIDAVQAKTIIEKLEPRVAILMHYRTPVSGYSLLEDLDSIRKKLPETEVLDSTSLELNGQESGTRIVTLKAIQ